MKNLVRELRTEAGLTQQQLAEMVHVPSLLLAYRLALVFGTTVEELYCLAENKEQEDREHDDWE